MKKSLQETFNIVVGFLRKQGERCGYMNHCGVFCPMYRHEGHACAVGCLIADEDYSEALEGHQVDFIYDLIPSLQVHTRELLSSLQNAHDGSLTKEDLEKAFRDVAELFLLSLPKEEVDS